MKIHSWKISLQICLLFSFCFYGVVYRGDKGSLENPDLIRMIYQPLDSFSGWFTDLKFKIRGDQKIENKILIVSIDTDSIEKFGRWPWHRDVFARILEEINKYGPKVIGLDLIAAENEKRLPEGLRRDLSERGLQDLAEKYESDPVFENALRKIRDELVMGIASLHSCQSTQSADAYGSSCPKLDDEYEVHFEDHNFMRFTLSDYESPQSFDLEKSPLYISRNPLMNKTEFQNAAAHLGLVDINPDSDGVVRKTVLIKFANEKPLPSFAVEIARHVLKEKLSLKIDEEQKIQSLKFAQSGKDILISPLGRMDINFRGSPSLIPRLSVVDLMDENDRVPVFTTSESRAFPCESCGPIGRVRGRAPKGYSIEKAELLKDAIVLIGTTDLQNDLRPIPNHPFAAGVEGHAMIVDNLLSGDAFKPLNSWSYALIILFLLSIGGFLLGVLLDPLPSNAAVLLSVGALGGLAAIDFGYLFPRGVNLNTGFVYLEFFLIAFLVLLNKYVAEEAQKKFIRRAFSRFVSPQVVKTIIDDPKKLSLGGERRELTVMFSDIRGFMPFSTILEPQELHAFLNEYHDTMTRIVIEKGTLDKYIGDAIMAFWGAPLDDKNHALHACQAALRMAEELRRLNQIFDKKYGRTIGVGIGINSGPCIVGNMGSKDIFSYTAIGDDVNLASRVERLTRVYGVQIVATTATLNAIRNAGAEPPDYRVLDLVQVMGADEGTEVVQILDREYPPDSLNLYQEARSLYHERKWDKAIELFEETLTTLHSEMGIVDTACDRMIERCEKFKVEPPPEDWNGIYTMTRK